VEQGGLFKLQWRVMSGESGEIPQARSRESLKDPKIVESKACVSFLAAPRGAAGRNREPMPGRAEELMRGRMELQKSER
jgi:hypothetical protein